MHEQNKIIAMHRKKANSMLEDTVRPRSRSTSRQKLSLVSTPPEPFRSPKNSFNPVMSILNCGDKHK